MRKIVYGTTALVLVGILSGSACRWLKIKSQDEGPIIVQNGSMNIDTANDAEWTGENGQWSNETGKDHGGDLWVWVYLKGSTDPACSGQGTPVEIDYSEGGFKAKFDVVGNNPPRTKASPKGQLDMKSKQRLVHGEGDNGYITGVEIHNQPLMNCTITSTNLTSIHICSTGDQQKCK